MTEETPGLRPEEQAKKHVAERLDRAGLLYSGKVVTDHSKRMLKPPPAVSKYAGTEYVLASEPPRVDFGIIPVQPVFFSKSPVDSQSTNSNEAGPWACWSQANYDTRTGKFYSCIGDHGKYGGHIFPVEYDPAARTARCLPEINRTLGRGVSIFTDGKVHGWLDFYQSKHLENQHLWFCTYWAKYPEPDEEDYASGYTGGHIMSCDPLTGNYVDYGVPLKRASWPYHRMDTTRGIMYAVGMFSEFLAWDVNEQRTLWAGYLPDGMAWYVRALLIEEETGMVYCSNAHQRDPERHFLKYDPFKNRFSILECHVPATSSPPSELDRDMGTYAPMRAHTAHRGPDGLFWCATLSGQLFTFDPVKEEIVDRGPNWCGQQRYTASMARSPGGRYVYYAPGAHGHGYSDGSPLIQYDTRTGTRKVLVFFFPYYFEKYGYTAGGTFSIKLDEKGERLFMVWNGAFVEHEGDVLRGDVFGQCSVMLVHIPENERPE
ncbi:MAG TPA: hypothetical protein PKY01_07450 [Candidatus Hydrogenedentes bacterium]|nr:hypothetical protein [Candidatus Hydrogenedentota bacterium]